MRVRFSTQREAQTFALAIHNRMIADDRAYASSVNAGHTKAWAIPYQDLDESGKPLSSDWFVNLKDRVLKVTTSADRSRLEAYRG